ncbi:MAG: type I polyketide synthase, partial [Blastocatellia bacterium]
AWEALENAGYNAEAYEGMIGVYAGASMSTYLLYNVLGNSIGSHDGFQAMIGNDKDFLSTRVSYELNLKGPSINVQTACSTSLVAAHLAYQGLLAYQCDMALAGGVSIQVPQRTGYYYQEGGVNSPDGHCRTFDAQAAGTVFGSGVGIVVMKRLADALADGDSIHAIIKGSAINNDGSTKVGYTAPSLDGQAQVVALAQLIAGVEAESISYIEAHGTATALGDPVEISALTKAFRGSTKAKNFCALGSVKTNVGHLDAAAGVTGLIKTVLALKNKMLPPSLHFNEPNPRIDFEDSPFYVNSKLREWDAGATPRRAGVSSFGIGGTNAHVIVEEAPPAESSGESRSWQVLMLSARTSGALEAATCNLATRLRQIPEANLADAAYTLQVGRKVFKHRRAVICQNAQDAVTALETLDAKRVFTVYQEPQDRPIVFMFPGGGAQYVNMGLDLYREEPIFRAHVEECSEILKSYTGYDLRDRLYPSQYEAERSSEQMRQTSLGLPALFTVEYALAKLWMSWGIRPHAMIGHSLGEYVAACLAGVFSLEDALSLVVLRAELFERLPRGGMLSVPLAEREARLFMDQRLSIAANNAPSQCVVSGPVEAIEDMAKKLASKEVEFRRIQIDVAAHSQMVTPMLAEFTRFVESLELNPPTIAYVSNVTGTWITEAQATDPSYWQRHLRQTVRFADGLEELFKEPGYLLLEVGPGQTLSTLAKMQSDNS